MIRSNLCDYSDGYIHVKRIITVPITAGAGVAVNNTDQKVIFKNCATFTTFISEINNTQLDDDQDIDIVMPMYNLIEYSDAYSKKSGSLQHYYRDEHSLDDNNNIIDFPANNNNGILFKFKKQMTGEIGNGGIKNVEIMVPLKYLSNFQRTLEMSLINCKISLQLKWSKGCIIVAGTAENQEPKFEITDTRLCLAIVTLSTQDNVKLLKQLESGFKRTINWNKNLSKTKNQKQNRYLNFLIDASFQGVNRLFVLSFKDEDGRECYKQYYLPTVEIKDDNVMIGGKIFFISQ